MALAQGSPWAWGCTGNMPSGLEDATWLCLAKAFVAGMFPPLPCCSHEPETLSVGFLWHCGGSIVVAIVDIARDKQLFSLLKALY